MPRAKYIQIIALCLTLVTELSDWRWLQPDDGPERHLFEWNNSQVFPTGLLVRGRLQQHIEAPPVAFALPPDMLASFAHPDQFVVDVPNEPPIAPPADNHPIFGQMSLQC